jgi:RNA polymerase sigma-70 factor (ECF subfamily)
MHPLAATFPSLHDDVVRPLLRYARSRVRNPALAEDAVSATLLAALESGMRFDAPGAGLAWLRGVLRHKLADELRRQQRETPSDDDALGEHDAPWCDGAAAAHADPEHASQQRELVQRMLEGCTRLPARQREALVLKELCERDADEVCRTLDIKPGHLWVLLHRARAHLRTQLAR